jgi:DNA repair protein RadC
MERFGSFRGVMDAEYEELLEVDGIGEQAATLIKFSAAVARRYALSEFAKGTRYTTVESVGKYFVAKFMGEPTEKTYAMLLNGKSEMIDCKLITDGTFVANSATAQAIMTAALKSKAYGVVLAHNHPVGLAIPSTNDIELTAQLDYLCSQLGVCLLEHIVVAENAFMPLMRSHLSDRFSDIKLKRSGFNTGSEEAEEDKSQNEAKEKENKPDPKASESNK